MLDKRFADMTEPEIREHLNKMGRLIEEQLPAGPGPRGGALFVLVVFEEDQIAQYLSNARRDGIIASLRELIAALENKEDVPR